MTRIYSRIIGLLLLSAVLFSGCNDVLSVSDMPGRALAFNAEMISTNNFSDNIATKSANSSELTLSDENGSMSLPVALESYDSTSPLTKGTLVNNNDDGSYGDIALAQLYSPFYAYAYNGTQAFFTKGTGNLETVTLADGKWASEHKYNWPDNTELTFFAYANAPASTVASFNCDNAAETLNYLAVPESAGDQKDILLGYYSGKGADKGKSREAGISFLHPLTTVIFKLGSAEALGNIKSISIVGVAAKGTVTLASSGTLGSWSVSDFSGKVSQSDNDGLTVSSSKIIGEPFIIIPQDTRVNKVYLRVEPVSGPAMSTEITTDNWLAGKVNVYTIGYDDDEYVFELWDDAEIEFSNTVKSAGTYVTLDSYKINAAGESTPVPFRSEYSLDDGETWAPFAPNNDDGSVTIANLYGLFDEINESSEDWVDIILYSARKKGRPAASEKYGWEEESFIGQGDPVDLSLRDANGDVLTQRNSANCYVIHHPGYYKFPLVYGNALKNGSINSGAYSTSNSGPKILSTFLNCKGLPISNGYILSDVAASHPKACLLWQDAWEGKTETDAGEGVIQSVSISGSGQSAYITFQTASGANLVESNAVIALYDDTNNNGSYDDGTDLILWSWHIWVSNYSFDQTSLRKANDNHSFSPAPLGLCRGRRYFYYVEDDYKKVLLRFTQTSGHAAPITISVTQPTISKYSEANCVYYQTGRKDPLLALLCDSYLQKPWYSFDGTEHLDGIEEFEISGSSSIDAATLKVDIANEIKNPGKFGNSSGYRYRPYYNLWSMSTTDLWSESMYGTPSYKTIYDPSPYGFMVPPHHAFKELTKDKLGDCSVPDMDVRSLGDVEFPVQGCRMSGNSGLYGGAIYMTSSARSSDGAYGKINVSNGYANNTYSDGNLNHAYPILPMYDALK